MLLTWTSSHMWGRWYLPMFLLRDGLLTLINIDSLISLERFCSSLPTTVKLLIVVEWPEMLLWSNIGEGAFRCSLNLSPNVLAVSPVFMITFQPVTFISIDNTTLFGDMVLIFRCHQFILYSLPLTWMPYPKIHIRHTTAHKTQSHIIQHGQNFKTISVMPPCP